MMLVDFPNVRAIALCPLCEKHKDVGSIVCWSCYRNHAMRYGNFEAELLIERAENKLREQRRVLSVENQ